MAKANSNHINELELIEPGDYRFSAVCKVSLVRLAQKYRINLSDASRRGILQAIKEKASARMIITK